MASGAAEEGARARWRRLTVLDDPGARWAGGLNTLRGWPDCPVCGQCCAVWFNRAATYTDNLEGRPAVGPVLHTARMVARCLHCGLLRPYPTAHYIERWEPML